MNEIRRTILWVIFGFSMVLLWDQWQIHNGHKPTFFPQATAPNAAQPAGAAPAATASGTPPAATSVAGASAVPGGAAAPAAAQKERIEVKTDVLQLSFDSEGGSLVRSVFNKYGDLKHSGQGFVLLDEGPGRVYVAQTGLIGADGLPTHKTVMKAVPGERELKDGQNQLEVKFESPEQGGVKLVKTYVIRRGAYDLTVRHEVVNTSSAPLAPQLYLQLVRDGNKPEGESSFYSTFTGPAI